MTVYPRVYGYKSPLKPKIDNPLGIITRKLVPIMSEELIQTVPDTEIPIQETVKDNKRIEEYTSKIKRTLVACFAGAAAGILSYYTQGSSAAQSSSDTHIYLAFFLMLAAIVLQKHIFMLMRIDTGSLGKKDWFYQGFMTFAFWFVSWTFLMSGSSAL